MTRQAHPTPQPSTWGTDMVMPSLGQHQRTPSSGHLLWPEPGKHPVGQGSPWTETLRVSAGIRAGPGTGPPSASNWGAGQGWEGYPGYGTARTPHLPWTPAHLLQASGVPFSASWPHFPSTRQWPPQWKPPPAGVPPTSFTSSPRTPARILEHRAL